MSWLGGSLSSLTGQLSNLTKDILTEGTEEVDDPSTELKLAKDKIEQLNSLLTSQRLENERFKRLNKDLEEKAESSELQINAISREYRGVLESKEKELKLLKEQHQELLEQQAHTAALSVPSRDPALLSSSSHHDHNHSWSSFGHRVDNSVSFDPEGDHGDWDFDDSIRLQRENNLLRTELQKLQSEVKHWRSVASQLGQNVGQSSDQQTGGADVISLQRQMELLAGQLAKKQEELQQQAASLHEHYHQKVSKLKSAHKAEFESLKSSHQRELESLETRLQTEVESLQKKLNVLEHHSQEVSDLKSNHPGSRLAGSGSTHDGQRPPDQQAELTAVLDERDKFQNGCHYLEGVLVDLQVATDELQRYPAVASDEILQSKVSNLVLRLRESEAEREVLRRELEEKNEISHSLHSVRTEQELLLASTQAAIEQIGDADKQHITAELFQTLERENLLLKEEKLKLQEHVVLLEKATECLTAEKWSLLNQVSELNSKTRSLRGKTGEDVGDNTDNTEDSQHADSSSDVENLGSDTHMQNEVEKELALLRAQLANQNMDASSVEMERADWLLEREALEDVITDLRRLTQEQEEEMRSLKSGKISEVTTGDDRTPGADLDKLQTLEAEILSLREEKMELENALEELDGQHYQAQEQLIQQRDQLMAQLADRSAQIQQQQEEIELLNLQVSELRAVGAGGQLGDQSTQERNLQEKCEMLEAELADVKYRLKESSCSLETEIAELREKLHKGGLVINDLHMDKQELQEELKSVRAEVAAKVAKIKEMREANISLESEKKRLEEKILEMEDRLSEMEEEVERWQQMNEDRQVQQMKAEEEQGQVERLKSQLVDAQKEKQLLSRSLMSLSSGSAVEDISLEDGPLKKIIEEEAKVRRKMEEDTLVIERLRAEVEKLYEAKQKLKKELQEVLQAHEVCVPRISQLENELIAAKVSVEMLGQTKSELEMSLDEKCRAIESLSIKLSIVNNELDKVKTENNYLSELVCSLKNKTSRAEVQNEDRFKNIRFENEYDMEEPRDDSHESLERMIKEKTEFEVVLASKTQEVDQLKEMLMSAQKDAVTAQKELQNLENVCFVKDEEIRELKTRVLRLEDCGKQAQISVNQEKTKRDTELSEELISLKNKNVNLEMSLNQLQLDLRSVMNVVQGMYEQHGEGDVVQDADINKLITEIERLKSDVAEKKSLEKMVFQLEAELTVGNDKIAELHKELQQARDIIRRHEAGITDLNEKTDQQRRQLQLAETDAAMQKNAIAVLRQTSIDAEARCEEMEEKMKFVLTLLTDQQKELLLNYPVAPAELPALEYKELPAIEFLVDEHVGTAFGTENMDGQHRNINGVVIETSVEEIINLDSNVDFVDEDVSSSSSHDRFAILEKELDVLRERIKEKDAILAELQKSNASFLLLLEKGGGALDKTLVNHLSVHKLESELRSLRVEREQIMAVVTEKSRENSTLKSEVHRLMDVVSAGQAAIVKLQEDLRSLEQKRRSPPREDEHDDDMRREALANMARLVRDRETEIEALKQKNDTLLAVLQAGGETQAAVHLAPLLHDKEILSQQVAALSSEREQLITCLTQKHSESLAYHAEIQRLSAILKETQMSHEQLQKDYASLKPLFEDKSQALSAVQNELIQCKQKLAELEVRHGELIHRSHSQDTYSPSTSSEVSLLQNELESLRQQDLELRNMVSQQEEKIQVLAHRSSDLEENLMAKDSECSHLKKQIENSKFQISEQMAELSELRAEKDLMNQRNIAKDTESASLREAYNKICMDARDKDIEVSSLKEQVMTLTSLFSQQQGEQGQVTQLMREHELLVATSRQLQQERDQQAMIAEQRAHEIRVLRTEVSQLKDKEMRQTKELERLRAHLLEIEEGFTKDAIEAEDREKELRNRLAAAEEQLLSSSVQVDSVSKESRRQLESLQQQLQHLASQRDSAYMQVASMQEQCQQYASSLANLQLVLEHFQKEKDAAIAMETEHLQNECKVLRIEVKELQQELEATRGDLAEALEGLEAASRLSEQLDRKQEAVIALKEEVLLREHALNAAEEEIRKLSSSTEAKVDKTLMHNMVLAWMMSPENKRMEIVHLMGNILSFTQEDYQKIEAAHRKGGLLSSFFGKTSTSPARPSSSSLNQSFSELFVKFLEKESSPPPTPLRLPAEAMVAETQHRHKPTFNPFMAPRHVMTSDSRRASSPSSHLLLPPDSPTSPTPLFSPLTSVSSSTESAILKDVLGQR